jgi:hypothetical protein
MAKFFIFFSKQFKSVLVRGNSCIKVIKKNTKETTNQLTVGFNQLTVK